jgi:type VI secretion system secreted protein VgrG
MAIRCEELVKMTRNVRIARRGLSMALAAALALGMLAVGPTAFAASPPTVGLGTAAAFAILAGTPDITNTGPSTVNGDVGIHPAVAVSGFPPGTVNGTIHAGDAVALQAKSDLVTAYNDAAGRPVTTTVAAGALGGLTLVGGVYNAGGVSLNLTGSLTLNAENDPNAVWIFQATSDLITASSSTVTFINGGNPCNVFWQVTSSATLGSGSTFVGTILALTSITMATGVSMQGRALARNGTVTLINDSITRPTCATTAPTAAPGAPTAAPGAPTTPPTETLASEATTTTGSGPIVVVMVFLGAFLVLARHWRFSGLRRR